MKKTYETPILEIVKVTTDRPTMIVISGRVDSPEEAEAKQGWFEDDGDDLWKKKNPFWDYEE